MAKIYRSRDTPRDAAMRSTVSPILLFGVDAPAVTPTVSGPAESHPGTHRPSVAPTGRNRIVPATGSMQLASAMWEVGALSWQIAARCVGLLELYPPITTMRSSGSAM